jgi:hypothetical protein
MSNNKHTQAVDFTNPNADKIISASTQEQMSLDLNKLENKLDEALSNETTETLTKFLNDKRMTNNKQQTAMKLYTQEQAKYFFECGRNFKINGEVTFDVAEQFVNPIELPSDEELNKQFDIDEFDPYDVAYLGGAIRMRNLIQGGNK